MKGDDVLTTRQMLRIVLGLAIFVVAVFTTAHAATLEATNPTEEFRQAMWYIVASMWWLTTVIAVLR